MARSDLPTVAPVSVVVSTLDRPGPLARCLDALLQGTRLPGEIVVVDQGDASMTTTVLEPRGDAGVPLVHVIQRRRGLSVSQNAGVERASFPVVSIVDDDCVPDARWVEVAAEHHARATGPLLLAGRVLPLPPDGERTMPLSIRASTLRAVLPPDAPPWEVGTGGNFSVTRASFLGAGGNDERLGTGTSGRAGNDLDLFHRLMRTGVQARFEPDLLVQHERATPAEYRGRAWTYGFGMGMCVASWLAARDDSAVPILVAWVAMRARLLAMARRPSTILNEVRVVLGTVHGLWHGWRSGSRGSAVERIA